MTALTWDGLAERFFETGVSNGVLYSQENGVYNLGVAWNGLTNVTEQPSGAESNKQYADNIPYLNLLSAEEFGATISCFTAPDGFLVFDGVRKTVNGVQIGMQSRPVFGFSWKTKKGNALNEDLGYILHLAYGLQASPSEKSYDTVNDSPAPTTFSWTVSSTPVEIAGHKPSAIIKIDSTDPDVDLDNLAALETILYGSAGVDPRLPLPDEVDDIMGNGVVTVTPTPLAYNDATDTIVYSATPGVVYVREDTGEEVTANIPLSVGQKLVISAHPASGYNFTGTFVDSWLYSYTP
jgi:hypothetical protein